MLEGQTLPPPGTQQMRLKRFTTDNCNDHLGDSEKGLVHLESCNKVGNGDIDSYKMEKADTQSLNSDASSTKSQIFKVARLTARRLSGLKEFVSDLSILKKKGKNGEPNVQQKNDAVDDVGFQRVESASTSRKSGLKGKPYSIGYISSRIGMKSGSHSLWSRPAESRSSGPRSVSNHIVNIATPSKPPRPSNVSLRTFYAFGARSAPLINKGAGSSVLGKLTLHRDRSLSSGYSGWSSFRNSPHPSYQHNVLNYSRQSNYSSTILPVTSSCNYSPSSESSIETKTLTRQRIRDDEQIIVPMQTHEEIENEPEPQPRPKPSATKDTDLNQEKTFPIIEAKSSSTSEKPPRIENEKEREEEIVDENKSQNEVQEDESNSAKVNETPEKDTKVKQPTGLAWLRSKAEASKLGSKVMPALSLLSANVSHLLAKVTNDKQQLEKELDEMKCALSEQDRIMQSKNEKIAEDVQKVLAEKEENERKLKVALQAAKQEADQWRQKYEESVKENVVVGNNPEQFEKLGVAKAEINRLQNIKNKLEGNMNDLQRQMQKALSEIA